MANKNTTYKYIDDDDKKKITFPDEPSVPTDTQTTSEPVAPTSQATQPHEVAQPSAPDASATPDPVTTSQVSANFPLGYSIPIYGGSQWDTKAQKALDEYEDYTYEDYLQSKEYKQLEEQYSQAGQQSMEDTLGQVSARTGGLASTYATGAAQKSYDQFMRKLFDVANQMYNDERDEILNKYGVYNKLAQQDYNRFGDVLSLYNNERNFAYKQQSDAIAAEQKQQNEAKALAQKQVDSMIEAGEMPSNELIDQAGYEYDFVKQMVESYKKTFTPPTLTPQQAYDIYNGANISMSQMGIKVSGMLTYGDWLKVKNDVAGIWRPNYGVTEIGYNIARNSKTYVEYAENFVTYMSENHAAITPPSETDTSPSDITDTYSSDTTGASTSRIAETSLPDTADTSSSRTTETSTPDTTEAKYEDVEYPIDMASVTALGYGPINAERLYALVKSGEVEKYVENGKTKFRRTGRPVALDRVPVGFAGVR